MPFVILFLVAAFLWQRAAAQRDHARLLLAAEEMRRANCDKSAEFWRVKYWEERDARERAEKAHPSPWLTSRDLL